MWCVRLVLVVLLFGMVGTFGFFLKHRRRYERLLENSVLNILMVVAYNTFSYLLMVLPPDRSVLVTPAVFFSAPVRTGFPSEPSLPF